MVAGWYWQPWSSRSRRSPLRPPAPARSGLSRAIPGVSSARRRSRRVDRSSVVLDRPDAAAPQGEPRRHGDGAGRSSRSSASTGPDRRDRQPAGLPARRCARRQWPGFTESGREAAPLPDHRATEWSGDGTDRRDARHHGCAERADPTGPQSASPQAWARSFLQRPRWSSARAAAARRRPTPNPLRHARRAGHSARSSRSGSRQAGLRRP